MMRGGLNPPLRGRIPFSFLINTTLGLRHPDKSQAPVNERLVRRTRMFRRYRRHATGLRRFFNALLHPVSNNR